ncbi:MAG: GNAT family N-acetyltransferase [Planctomycetota bacterium]
MPDTPSDGYETRACSSADREEQARLFNACFKKGANAKELAWRYDDGPHGASLSFVTRDREGRAVSGYACNPRVVRTFGEHAALVGETGDVMTHPDARGKGLFSELDRACMRAAGEAGWAAVFGLPNRRSAPIFTGKLGWHQVGTIRPHTFLFDGGARARRLRSREGRLAGFSAPFAARSCARRRGALERAGGGFDTREVERFPAEVAELDAALSKRFAFMVRRDADYLDWRFARNPSGLHRALVARRGAAFAGYVVVQLPREGEDVGFLVDVLAEDPAAHAALLSAGLERLEREGAVAAQATAIDGSWWQDRLREAGFLDPKPENHLVVISYLHDVDHPVARVMLDAAQWYLTDGDRDDATMG